MGTGTSHPSMAVGLAERRAVCAESQTFHGTALLTSTRTLKLLTLGVSFATGEHPGDHNHQDVPIISTAICDATERRTAMQMGGVLRQMGGVQTVFPFPQSTAIQIGGVLQFKLQVYCNVFLGSNGGWHSSELQLLVLTGLQPMLVIIFQHETGRS